MRLRNFVHVLDKKGHLHTFGPASDVPAWAVEKITNPKVWAEDEPSEVVAIDEEPPEEIPVGAAERPPTSGKGSGLAEWQAYAKARGLSDEDLEGASRDDLIATLK